MKKVFLLLIISWMTQGNSVLAKDDPDFMASVLTAKVIELNFLWSKNSPLLSFNPPYSSGLHTSHAETEGMIPGISFAAELMFFSGQHGAPTIDAIGHIASEGKLYGGSNASASEGTEGLKVQGIEHYPKERFVNRGLMLDVARYKGLQALEPGYVITASDLEETALSQSVVVHPGDSVLIHTGHGVHFDSNPEKYLAASPGIGEESAKWLAAKEVFLVAADTVSLDVGFPFPGHRILIAEHGIHIVENMNQAELASELAERGDYVFVLVLNPLRLKGATASPLNAFVLLP